MATYTIKKPVNPKKPLTPTSREKKPLKPSHRTTDAERRGLKPMKSQPRVLKPLKPSSREKRPMNVPGNNYSNTGKLSTFEENCITSDDTILYTNADIDQVKTELTFGLLNIDYMLTRNETTGEKGVLYFVSLPDQCFNFLLSNANVLKSEFNSILNRNTFLYNMFYSGLDEMYEYYKVACKLFKPSLNSTHVNSSKFASYATPPLNINDFLFDFDINQSNGTKKVSILKNNLSDIDSIINVDKGDSGGSQVGGMRPIDEFNLDNLDDGWNSDFPLYPYPEHPPSYCGFVDSSHIKIRATSGNQSLLFSFVDSNAKYQSDWSMVKLHIGAGQNKLHKYTLAFRTRIDGKDILFNKLPVPHTGYLYGNDFDSFSICVDDGPKVKINSTLIYFNHGTIYNSEEDPIFKDTIISKTDSLSLRVNKWVFCKEAVGSNDDIVSLASTDLRQAWHPKYGAAWGIEWCSHFCNWVLRHTLKWYDYEEEYEKHRLNDPTANIMPGPVEDYQGFYSGYKLGEQHASGGRYIYEIGEPIGAFSFPDFFINEKLMHDEKYHAGNRYVSKSHYEYDELGDLIKPGFYVRVLSSDLTTYHATIFVRWKTEFQKNKSVIYFIGIGGNQTERVKLSNFCVYKSRSSYKETAKYMAVSFDPNDGIRMDKTGFGVTTHFGSIREKFEGSMRKKWEQTTSMNQRKLKFEKIIEPENEILIKPK